MMLKSDQMELMYKNGNTVIKYLGLLQKIICIIINFNYKYCT